MKISANKYALALFESLRNKNDKESLEVINRFVKLLAENHHLSLAYKISYFLKQIYKKEAIDLDLKCSSARPLSSSIIQELAKHFKIDKVEETVDKSLLGGIIIRYQDTIIDASMKTRLKNLNNHLKI